jgi:hypothetical protein
MSYLIRSSINGLKHPIFYKINIEIQTLKINFIPITIILIPILRAECAFLISSIILTPTSGNNGNMQDQMYITNQLYILSMGCQLQNQYGMKFEQSVQNRFGAIMCRFENMEGRIQGLQDFFPRSQDEIGCVSMEDKLNRWARLTGLMGMLRR